MILLSVILSSMAAITGILAIGTGRHWQFNVLDYFRGKRNAILYLWVTSSTIFSILHAGMLADYGLTFNWAMRNPDTWKWMILHAAMGMLLIGAHLYIAYTLSKEVGPVDKFLWGSKRRAVQ